MREFMAWKEARKKSSRGSTGLKATDDAKGQRGTSSKDDTGDLSSDSDENFAGSDDGHDDGNDNEDNNDRMEDTLNDSDADTPDNKLIKSTPHTGTGDGHGVRSAREAKGQGTRAGRGKEGSTTSGRSGARQPTGGGAAKRASGRGGGGSGSAGAADGVGNAGGARNDVEETEWAAEEEEVASRMEHRRVSKIVNHSISRDDYSVLGQSESVSTHGHEVDHEGER